MCQTLLAFEQSCHEVYPDSKTEKKILKPLIEDQEFVELLVKWADIVRQSYEQDAIDEVISTRRLVHIVETFGIFGDKMKSITLCLNRFDDDTKASFIDLYTKVDSGATVEQILAPEPEITVDEQSTDDTAAQSV